MDLSKYIFPLEKSPYDPRDYTVESIYPTDIKVELPEEWDLRSQMQPIRDQGSQGTCSAQSVSAMKEWQELVDVEYNNYFSPQFVYNLRENQASAGMYPRDTMEILYKIGIVPEKEYPYNTFSPISEELKQKAASYKIQGYAQINTIESAKRALFMNGPIYVAFPVYNPYNKEFWKQEYPTQNALGGHACFTGDTKISLLDGRELSFVELEQEFKDKEFWVYSSDEFGNIIPGKAHSSRMTQKNVKIVEITLDNGEKIKCTENHKFLLKNGNYKEVKYLNTDDSLMPLYKRITISNIKGYEQILNNNTNKWEYTHIIASSIYNNINEKTNKTVIHHKNFNKRDNNPENLILMDKDEHWKLHAGYAESLNRWVKTPEGRKFLSENAKKMWAENEEFRENNIKNLRKQGKLTLEKLEKQGRKNPLVEWSINNPEESYKMRAENGKKNSAFLHTTKAKLKAKETFNKHMQNDVEFKEKKIEIAINNINDFNELQKTKEYWTPERRNKKRLTALKCAYKKYKYKKYNTFDEYILKEKNLILNEDNILVPYNHKIIKIQEIGYDDVYDITVEKYHNFALSVGIFVHNCTSVGYLKDCFIIRNSWSAQWGDQGYTYYLFKDFGMHFEMWTTIDADSNIENLENKAIQYSSCCNNLFKRLFKKIKK